MSVLKLQARYELDGTVFVQATLNGEPQFDRTFENEEDAQSYMNGLVDGFNDTMVQIGWVNREGQDTTTERNYELTRARLEGIHRDATRNSNQATDATTTRAWRDVRDAVEKAMFTLDHHFHNPAT